MQKGITFSVKIVLSHNTYKLRRGTLWCFRKVLASKNFMLHDFLSNFFCLTVPKNFVGEPFRVSLISGIEKFYASEGYVTILDFLSKFFCLTVPKIFAGEPFCAVFQKISGSEKVYG